MKVGDLVRFLGHGHFVEVGDLGLVLYIGPYSYVVLHQKTGWEANSHPLLLEKVS